MARITVEDCLEKVENRFLLVMMKEKKASVSAALDAGKLAMAAAAITHRLLKIRKLPHRTDILLTKKP